MFDIGAGEFIVIAIVALLVVGPERLPALARQWTSTLRAVREQAAKARTDLQDSVGADVANVADMLRQADPRRILNDGVLGQPTTVQAQSVTPAPAPLWDADTP
jgi:sec-independent protein translocase protein TatB